MPKAHVLELVAADAERGRTGPAVRRLSSLVHAHPTDLDLRRRLADLYLRAGNLAEAGRWGYLDPAADATARAAFERRYRWPRQRLRALRWPGGPALAATGHARSRLADLVALASREPESPGGGSRPDREDPTGRPAGPDPSGGPGGTGPGGAGAGVGQGGPARHGGPGGPGRTGRAGGTGRRGDGDEDRAADEDDDWPVPRRHSPRARLVWATAFALACLVLLGLVVLGAVTVVGWLR